MKKETLEYIFQKDLEKANKRICQKYIKIIEKEIIENFDKFPLTNISKDRKDKCPITIYGVGVPPYGCGIEHCCDHVYIYIKEKEVYLVLDTAYDFRIHKLTDMVIPTKYVVKWWDKVKQIKNI